MCVEQMDVLLPMALTTWTSLGPFYFLSTSFLSGPQLGKESQIRAKATVTGFLSWCDVKDFCGWRFSPCLDQMPSHHRASIAPSLDPKLDPSELEFIPPFSEFPGHTCFHSAHFIFAICLSPPLDCEFHTLLFSESLLSTLPGT